MDNIDYLPIFINNYRVINRNQAFVCYILVWYSMYLFLLLN